jgi:hypothetical protein
VVCVVPGSTPYFLLNIMIHSSPVFEEKKDTQVRKNIFLFSLSYSKGSCSAV